MPIQVFFMIEFIVFIAPVGLITFVAVKAAERYPELPSLSKPQRGSLFVQFNPGSYTGFYGLESRQRLEARVRPSPMGSNVKSTRSSRCRT